MSHLQTSGKKVSTNKFVSTHILSLMCTMPVIPGALFGLLQVLSLTVLFFLIDTLSLDDNIDGNSW